MTKEEAIRAVIRNSTSAWFETYGKIYGKDRKQGVITPRCNYLQKKIQRVADKFEDLEMPARIMILKPRQKGSTTYGCALDYTMLRRESTSGVIIGGQVSQVDEAHAMLQTYQKNDTFDWGNTGDINSKSGSWSHGSRLVRETAGDAKAGIGGTHQILHAFEVSRWQEDGVNSSGEVLANIMKCVPLLPGTLINLESTAEGARGSFYTYWCNATDAEDFLSGAVKVSPGQFVRCFAAWFQFDDSAIRLDEEGKRQIEKTLDEESWYHGEKQLIESYGRTGDDGVLRLGDSVEDFDVWEQLAWRRWAIQNECKRDTNLFDRDYPHSWRTAFQKSGTMRFNTSGLAAMRKRAESVTPQYGIIEEAKRDYAFRQTPEFEATHVIFEKPQRGMKYLLAIDPMTGASQTSGADPDYHSVLVIRQGYWDSAGKWVRPCLAARVVQCRYEIDMLTDQAWRLAKLYGGTVGCKMVVEMNMDKGITELLKQRGANLYQREMFNRLEHKITKALGYQTNEKTREVLVEKLAGEIREWDTPGRGVDVACPKALDELENFVRKHNGRSEAADGFHDDDVIALGLCLELIDHATTYVPVTRSLWGEPPIGGRQDQQRPGAFS